jgi:hypothetical protein
MRGGEVFQVELPDGQEQSRGLDVAIDQAPLPEELHPADLQPGGVGAVVGKAHLVGLRVADAELRLTEAARHLSPPKAAAERGAPVQYIYRLAAGPGLEPIGGDIASCTPAKFSPPAAQ